MNERKYIELKQAKEIVYQEPLDVALLLRKDRLYTTFYNAFVHIYNLCLKQDRTDKTAFPYIIYAGSVDAYNVEYNAFIEGLSYGFESNSRNDFIRDFALASGKVRGLQSYPLLWLAYTMESFGLSYGSQLRFRGQAFYRPIVYEHREDSNIVVQMAAISFTDGAIKRIFGTEPDSVALFEAISYFSDRIEHYRQVAFGVKEAKEFWRGNAKGKKVLYSLV